MKVVFFLLWGIEYIDIRHSRRKILKTFSVRNWMDL